ncbi:MAG: dTDP-4-dehydrorhamnose reductase [Burkholderiaceae bacterium]|nr:dTDP-4-dehydrorhamnose reductase [Burkholderiaceae bacterium]
MKILLFGCNGQVGWELQRALAPLGEVVALDFDSKDFAADFSRPQELAATVRAARPAVIVNAAAHTAVDKAESEPDRARTLNAEAPGVLAREAASIGAWLVHYSTDYVFDGSGTRPWREDDPTGPLSVYGRTKLDGEQRIRASGCRHLILRTSWVYAARGGNFARTMIKLAAERDELRVVDDQIGAPTGADLLADVTAHALRAAMPKPELGGTYHAVAAGETSWHGYARTVIEWARAQGLPMRVPAERIVAVPSSAYPTPARRPLNSRLDTQSLRRAFGLAMPPWQPGVLRMLLETSRLTVAPNSNQTSP